MSWIIYPELGSKYGPCKSECRHIDCAQIKKEVKWHCPHCDKPLGYGKRITRSPFKDDQLAHVVCIEKHLDEMRGTLRVVGSEVAV